MDSRDHVPPCRPKQRYTNYQPSFQIITLTFSAFADNGYEYIVERSCTVMHLTVRVIRDKPGYFALKMQKAMKGLGTDDQALVRIIISRSECDMVQIKKSFEQQFQGRLADWIKVRYVMMIAVEQILLYCSADNTLFFHI